MVSLIRKMFYPKEETLRLLKDHRLEKYYVNKIIEYRVQGFISYFLLVLFIIIFSYLLRS